MFKNIDKDKIVAIILTITKIVSFLSLVMTVVIKTRVLLGLPNGTKEKESANEDNI